MVRLFDYDHDVYFSAGLLIELDSYHRITWDVGSISIQYDGKILIQLRIQQENKYAAGLRDKTLL